MSGNADTTQSGKRDEWSSKLGFVLAASGSAVGLGNLWKFPYITWNNDGGAFVLVYLLCIVVVGVPVMMAELVIGRRSRNSPVQAFEALGHRHFRAVGWLFVVTAVVILAFYTVIAGWSLSSFAQCLRWSVSGYQAPDPKAFDVFLADGGTQVGLGLAFLLATAVIVSRGISGGIEKAAKVLMPTLFAVMLYLLFTAATLDGFGRTLHFLFSPNLDKLTPHSVLEALGHAFFTLSLGMGLMITYGSYVQKKESLLNITYVVAGLDTLIALMACVIMFSIIFSVPSLEQTMVAGEGSSTVGMLFVTLPNLFYTQMAGGVVLGPLFYVLVAFAALSSTISLLEVVVSACVDRLGWARPRATVAATALVFVCSIGCALSLGASPYFGSMRLFGPVEPLNAVFTANKKGLLAIFDHLSANWLLPLGGLMITIYAGWVLEPDDALDELFPGRKVPPPVYRLWRLLVRYVCPIAIGWILFEVLRGGDFS